MTVAELIEELENYDEDMEVVLGMQQNYGTDWAYSISEVGEYEVSNFYDSKETNVVLSLGEQFGSVKYGG